MKSQVFIAHAKVLATAVVGALFGAGSTLVGQGVPDLHTQGAVGLAFGAFTWLVALVHRWETSPADAVAQVESGLSPVIEQVLPVFAGALARSLGMTASSSSSSAPCPHCGDTNPGKAGSP